MGTMQKGQMEYTIIIYFYGPIKLPGHPDQEYIWVGGQKDQKLTSPRVRAQLDSTSILKLISKLISNLIFQNQFVFKLKTNSATSESQSD